MSDWSLIRRKRKHGFTMTEIAIVLGIVGAVVGGVWAAASTINERNKINKLTQELQTVLQNMTTLYQNRPANRNTGAWTVSACGGVTQNANQTLISAGVFPGWAVTSPTTAVTPWGGGLVIYDPAGGFPNNTYRISFYCIPRDACIALILQATNCDPTQPGCPTKVLTYTGNGQAAPNPGPPKNWQMDPPTAANLCALNFLDPNANSVEFDYGL